MTKTKEKFKYKYVSQCRVCLGVEMIVSEAGKKIRQKSIVNFETLAKDLCYSCEISSKGEHKI